MEQFALRVLTDYMRYPFEQGLSPGRGAHRVAPCCCPGSICCTLVRAVREARAGRLRCFDGVQMLLELRDPEVPLPRQRTEGRGMETAARGETVADRGSRGSQALPTGSAKNGRA